MLILMLFAPQMNIIFAISTSNNPIINKIMHERGGIPQLNINLNLLCGSTARRSVVFSTVSLKSQ